MDHGPAAGLSKPPGHVLHAGCGGDTLPDWLACRRETRLDINPGFCPDIVASIVDLGNIGHYDAVYCSHCLEHVSRSEAGRALSEFSRVLRPGGYVFIFVPDLEDVSPTDEVLFVAPAGPITGLDLIYGKQNLVESMPHMAHRTGFIAATLLVALEAAGFDPASVGRVNAFNLFGAGVRP